MSWKLQNIFLWFLEVSWIGKRSKIYFLKFYKSWNVSEPSKYFLWFWKVSWSLTCPGMSCKLQNIFLWFLKVSWSFTSPGMSCMLQNIFLWCLKISWIARSFKITFLKFDKSWNVLQPSKYFSMIFKSILDCQKVQNNFPEVWQALECLASFKIFFYDF